MDTKGISNKREKNSNKDKKTIRGKKTKKEYKLTRKEQLRADDYLESNNATQSALKTYNTTSTNTAGNIGSTNLSKPKIKHYLADKSEQAGSNIEQIANDRKVKVDTRLKANVFIYEQVHGKAEGKSTTNIDKQQINI